LREKMIVDGVIFHLVDMAGLGRPSHPVERTGIARGRKIAGLADGLLIVLDASRPAGDEDSRLARKYRGKKTLVVLNKSDLPRKLAAGKVRELAGHSPVVEVSALKGRNIDRLRSQMGACFAPGAGKEEETILHAWQKDRLEAVLESLRRAAGLLSKKHSQEVFAEEVRTALRSVGELTGEVRAEEILDDIFGRFCVGK